MARCRSYISDSGRWEGLRFRQGDIVISVPSKSGTTWLQMLCALLIFQDPEFPEPLGELSPWLDVMTRRREDVIAQLDAQPHRRFIKSHAPLDGPPIEPGVTYLSVARLADTLDIDVPPSAWTTLVEAGSFTEMKTRADRLAPQVTERFWRDSREFFNQGTSG